MQPLKEILQQAQARRVALGHFNIADLVFLNAVFDAARDLNVPVLVGASEGERKFAGTHQLAALVRSLREELDYPVFLNSHGMLKSMITGNEKKHLDIERISEIKTATGVPLTLHGGSGTSDDDFKAAIRSGINIIHINTEFRVAWRRGLEQGLAAGKDEVVPYKILLFAVTAIRQVVSSRLRLFTNPVPERTTRQESVLAGDLN